MNAMTMDWSCSKKVVAREETIIRPWMERFHSPLPKGKQYWTMCGKCFDDSGRLAGCELDQVLKSGIITSGQFHGVDIDPVVISGNKAAWPGFDWTLGDFRKVMRNASCFSPGIVNCDTVNKPRRAARMIGDVMNLIDERSSGDLMLVANVVVEFIGSRKGDVIKSLSNDGCFMASWTSGLWEPYREAICEYRGSAKSDYSTVMGSIVLFRKGGKP